ncbi:sensor histidine kinase [Cohnella sp. CFH 77786]|uniref:sensor histidine kinase n=1 Tax=Cohnella sp. CFH 77786 TaxID=2662265 RepID=UPI001C610C93|nr:histidine kinase [Cohnella sp. CFH 77786]MBW5447134.1 sensor histidine kinase [Cohnella sp. CFH 77786]
MDVWPIGNKAVLLGFIALSAHYRGYPHDAWLILAFLLYLSLNIAIPLFRRTGPQLALAALSAVLAIACAWRLDPLFVLVLPVNLYELAAASKRSGWQAFLTVLLPVPFLPHPLIALYLTCACLSFLLLACAGHYAGRLAALEAEREKNRVDLQKLAKTLSENDEYIRQSEYTIKLEERNRLSQQIHDELGHSMAGALIQMEASRRMLASDRDKAAELLGNAISISKEGLERIRLTLKDLKPKAEEIGINRLRLFADELSAKRNIPATLSYEGDIDVITPIQWKVIQENATEAVTNTLKYAKATAIHIEIRVLNKFVKAVVSDNGQGAGKIVKGLGIVGMEERAASAGGMVIVDGSRGFSVTTLLPVGE